MPSSGLINPRNGLPIDAPSPISQGPGGTQPAGSTRPPSPGPGYVWDEATRTWSKKDSGLTDAGPGLGDGGIPIDPATGKARTDVKNGYGNENITPAPVDKGAADADAAQALRDKLLAERNQTPGVAPQVAPTSPPLTAAHAAAPAPIAAPQIAATPGITAGTVAAPTIAPIERVQAGTVAPTGGATAAQVNMDPQEALRQKQLSLLTNLEAGANGTAGPSVAELQLQRANSEAIAEQSSQVGAVHGYGALAAARAAGKNVGHLMQANGLDTAMLRAKEQQDQRAQLLQGLEGARGQDIGVASTQANLDQAANLKNADINAVRALKDADLKAAADMGNANAQNELSRRQAELTLTANTTNVTTGLEAAKSNQGVEAQKNINQANLDTDVAKTNVDTALKTNLTNAGFDQQALMQGSAQDLQRQLANAGFTLSQEQVDNIRRDAANNAALAASAQLLNYRTGQAQQDAQRAALAAQIQQANRAGDLALLGTLLSTAGAIGGAIIAGPPGAAAGAAAGAGAGTAIAASDRRMKTDIKPLYSDDRGKTDKRALLDSIEGGKGGDPVDELLSALHPVSFKYKDPESEGAAPGQRYGIIAQDLEKSPMGKSIVVDMPNGKKGIDTAQAVGVLLASMARMRQDMKRMGRR